MQERTPKTSPSALMRLNATISGRAQKCGSFYNGYCREKKNKKCDCCHSELIKSVKSH